MKLVEKILKLFIKGYQYVVSPLIGVNCRFFPSCSHYAHDAIEKHGVVRGVWLAIQRIMKCHPWGGSGHDPVPDIDRAKQ